MRTRINKYTIVGERQVKLDTPITIEDVRLIINETKKIVIASSMQKDNITIEGGVITYVDTLPISEAGDYFTIEIDKGETINDILGDVNVILTDVAEGKKQIADAINTKGGSASADSSFSQLAEDVFAMPTSGILSNGITQTEPFSFLKYLTTSINNEITDINDSEITTIEKGYAFSGNIALRMVVMSGLSTISGGSTFINCAALQNVELPSLATISGGNTFANCSSLQNVELPSLATISGGSTFANCSSLPNVELPSLATISGGSTFMSCTSLQNVELGTLIQCSEPFANVKPRLRNITIGLNTDANLPFQYWTATNVIKEGQAGIDELNENLYNNLLTKLYDHSQDGETRTLRLGWLAHVTQENIDYANSKGWTLTT